MTRTKDILTEAASTYEQKNQDYGESWKMIGVILYLLSRGEPIVLLTPQDFIAFGLFTRRLDKFARSFNGEFVSGSLNFEDAADSDEDESVYAAMQAENKYDRVNEDEVSDLLNEAMAFLKTLDQEDSEAVTDGGRKPIKPNYGKLG